MSIVDKKSGDIINSHYKSTIMTTTLQSVKTQETVKSIYDAFANGNIPLIIESVSEDFTWQDPCDSSVVPYGGTHKGRSEFLEFFHKLGGSTDTNLWQVDEYISEGNKVVATGRHGFQTKTTGKKAVTDWAMIWTFKNDTPVAGKAYYNTSATENAFRQ